MNWWQNLVYQWIQFLDALPTSAGFIDQNFAWTGNHSFTNELTYPSAETRIVRVPLTSALRLNEASALRASGPRILLAGDGTSIHGGANVDVTKLIPAGAIITGWKASVQPGTTDNLSIQLMASTTPHTNVGLGGAVVLEDAGHAGDGTQTKAGGSGAGNIAPAYAINYTTADTDILWFEITTSGFSSSLATVSWLEVTFTETRATGHF